MSHKKGRARKRTYKVKIDADQRFLRFWNYAQSEGETIPAFLKKAVQALADKFSKK